jgi:putative endonuclease
VKKKIKRLGKYHVYIVECFNGTYYTGYTNDLEARLKLHNSGNGAKYLRGKGPVKLVYAKEYRYYKNAVRAEIDIKKRTRAEKEAMIRAYAKSTEKLVPQPPSCFLRKQESGKAGG